MSKLVTACSGLFLVESIESMVEPLDKTIAKKLTKEVSSSAGAAVSESSSAAAVNAEVDRSLDVAKSAIRLAITINQLESAALTRKWTEFFDKISRRDPAAALFAIVIAESSTDV